VKKPRCGGSLKSFIQSPITTLVWVNPIGEGVSVTTFRAGDIFAFELVNNEWLCGRVMLDIKQQCIKPRLLKPDSPLVSFNGYLLVDVYRDVFEKPTAAQSEILIPGVFVSTGSLESGSWPIVGYDEIDPTQVEFPESLGGRGRQNLFIRGEITLPIDLSFAEINRLNVYSAMYPSRILNEICLYHLGRANEIDNPRLRDVELRSLSSSVLRFTEHRSEIYRLLGKDETLSYYEMSTQLGHDIRRFYTAPEDLSTLEESRVGEGETVILCPYCLGTIDEKTKDCPHCNRDTTKDAPLEMTLEEYYNEEKIRSFLWKAKVKASTRLSFLRQVAMTSTMLLIRSG
jgi:hypothetical protein